MLFKDGDGTNYQTRKFKGAVVSASGKPTDNQNWALGAEALSVHGHPSFERNRVGQWMFTTSCIAANQSAWLMVA
jgi:hypothetical protein